MARRGKQVKSLHNISTLCGETNYTKLKVLADEHKIKMSHYVGILINEKWDELVTFLDKNNPQRLTALAIVYGLENELLTERKHEELKPSVAKISGS